MRDMILSYVVMPGAFLFAMSAICLVHWVLHTRLTK